MAEFETRREERHGKTVQIVEGNQGNEVAQFTTCVEGDQLFDLFIKGAVANGHTIWDANKASWLVGINELSNAA